MLTRHETVPHHNQLKYKSKTLPERNSYQKKNKSERDENTISRTNSRVIKKSSTSGLRDENTISRTNSRVIKKSSTSGLHDNSRSNDNVFNVKPIRKSHSSLQINQNYKTNNLHREPPRDSSDIRMIYDYYQHNLRKDEVLYKFSSDVDRYGFVESEDNKSKAISAQREEYERKVEKKDAKRSIKWAHWVSQSKLVTHSGKFGSSKFVFPSGSKFVDRVNKGIPDAWRNPVWYFLVTKRGDKLIKTYKSLLKLPSAHERQIDLDIPRTLHRHIMFRTRYGPGQRALFNVLRAFSNYDKQVGYCQGMANLVTILLMYYSEEYAFIMLIGLFTKCDLHNLYIPGFPALMESFYIQEKFMNIYTPKISKHLNKLQISSTAYATKWYITLFSSEIVPHHTVLRIWDLLMLHGFDILYFVAVALLNFHKSILLASDFDHALTTLSSFMNIVDDDKLTKNIVKMYNKKERKRLIDTFKAEYKSKSNH